MPTNPVQERINGGMSPLAAFFTEATCAEACWYAREEVCRCSCGGANHGCMKTADGVQPARTARIDGYRYELKAVGEGTYKAAQEINKASGPRSVEKYTASRYDDAGDKVDVPCEYKYWWRETEPGAPARLKTPTDAQIASWPELSAYRDGRAWTDDGGKKHYLNKPYLLWVRIEQKKEAA